jgi:DNA-binding transcriptional MerR regulator
VRTVTSSASLATSNSADAAGGYRGPQVCSIVGITYRQLDYWARTNLLRPSLADAKGSGSQRRYSYTDLVELKVIKSLLDAGVSLSASRSAVEYLRTQGEDLANANLVLSGDSPLLVRDGGEILDLVRQGQGVLNIVPLASMRGSVDAAIHSLFGGSGEASVESAVAGEPSSGDHTAPTPAARAV